ncbi:hypothetical protein [Spirillospora sp. NPDC029432]|uniref:hypothetical protein n=1 Tax=Spirillospora sp. NPDC029432 TaxID=3154599 RepID=UPI003452BBBE
MNVVGGQDRQASGTGAETPPEIADVPDGRRAVLTPPSTAARVAGGLAGAVAGGAASRALHPLARRAAERYGLPANAIVRAADVLAPVLLGAAMTRLAGHRPRVKVVRRVP